MENTAVQNRPTIWDRIAIFGPHIDRDGTHVVTVTGRRLPIVGILRNRATEHINAVCETETGANVQISLSMLKLEVKPLSKISNEDAMGLKEFFDWESAGYSEDAILSNASVLIYQIISDYTRESGVSTIIKLIDYLRSRGYALPYGKWSVEELVGFGIFKLTE